MSDKWLFALYERDDLVAVFTEESTAQETAAKLPGFHVGDAVLLSRVPERVQLHYVQRWRDRKEETGTAWFWDFDIAGMPCTEFIAWGRTAAEARHRLEAAREASSVEATGARLSEQETT